MNVQLINAGPWTGGVTDQTAIVKASVLPAVKSASLILSTDLAFSRVRSFNLNSMWEDPGHKYRHKILNFLLSGLQPFQQYYYYLLLNDVSQRECVAAFKTLPAAGSRQDFKIAFGSCSGNKKFTNIRYPMPESFMAIENEPELLLFLHLGDLHYGNIRKPEIAIRLEKYDWMLRRKEPGDLFRAHAMAYVWDDHDFLGDDTDGGDIKNKAAAVVAREAYDLYVPHYPLAEDGTDGIYQSFVVGKVLFILTDNRFHKLHHGSDTSPRSMLGVKQRDWFKAQLLMGKNYDLIVWCNSLPWVGKSHPREVFWAGYSDERTSISNFIIENQVRNLCMLSGDAHMLAIDDGSNSGFSADGAGGFPLFHAAALESRPTRKGGIYSKGTKDGGPGRGIAGTGQYGVMEVKYKRDEKGESLPGPRVHWIGKRVCRMKANEDDLDCQILLTHDFDADKATILKKVPRSK